MITILDSTYKKKYLLSSVQNAMQILQIFKKDGKHELSLMDITREAGLPKSTTHRLISTLTNEGFLSQNPRTNKYRLGLSLLTLGGVISIHKEIYLEAFPLLEDLVQEIKESCHLCLLEKKEVAYFYRIEKESPEKLITDIGKKNPIHCTSEGQVLLAYQDQSYIDQVLEQDLESFTPHTITNPDVLKETLERIREKGYAISKEQFFLGYIGIAAPIRDYSSNVVSSLAIIGPTSRITEENYSFYINELINTASTISQELGYYGE